MTLANETPKPFPHEWEPDFSEGEPPLDSKICGICGKEHAPTESRPTAHEFLFDYMQRNTFRANGGHVTSDHQRDLVKFAEAYAASSSLLPVPLTPTEWRKRRGFDDNHWGDDHVQEYLWEINRNGLPVGRQPFTLSVEAVEELVEEIKRLANRLQWLEANLCPKHLEIQTCSSGPCPMCDRDEFQKIYWTPEALTGAASLPVGESTPQTCTRCKAPSTDHYCYQSDHLEDQFTMEENPPDGRTTHPNPR